MLQTTDASEVKTDKFRRVGTRRVRAALKAIRSVGNLANPKLYDFDVEITVKIIDALKSELAHAEKKFAEANGPAEFSL